MHQFKTVQCPQWGRGEFDSTLAYGPAVQKPDSRVGQSGGVCFQTYVSSAQQKYGVQHNFQSLGKEAFHKFVIEYIDNLFYNLFFSLHLEVFPLHTSSIHQIASLVPHLSLFNLRKKNPTCWILSVEPFDFHFANIYTFPRAYTYCFEEKVTIAVNSFHRLRII